MLYRILVVKELRAVQDYEATIGGIVLDPAMSKESSMYFSPKHSFTVSPKYAEAHEKKAHLVVRMLEIRIGRELLLQVSTVSNFLDIIIFS